MTFVTAGTLAEIMLDAEDAGREAADLYVGALLPQKGK